MVPALRTITLGLNVDLEAPGRAIHKTKEFFETARSYLNKYGLSSRCFRLTCQPVDELIKGRYGAKHIVADFARFVEDSLGEDIWFCLPGPFFRKASDPIESLDIIPEVIAGTRHVFMNTMVGSASGIHRKAIQKAGSVIRELAHLDDQHQANFRFAVMSNMPPNTPFFPASYHEGIEGFSIALELSGLINECVRPAGTINEKLLRFHQAATALIEPIVEMANALAVNTNMEFKGFDFALAPYPGKETSAVSAVENLNGVMIGKNEFVFSLYAINNILNNGFSHYPQVGYNGTMLSVLEDSYLAERVREKAVNIDNLLHYAMLCGCGLDMIPLPLETPSSTLASLIQAIATESIKWNKPLIARLLPSAVNSDQITNFKHDFIINTQTMVVDNTAFAPMLDTESFYEPTQWRPSREKYWTQESLVVER